MLFLIKSLLPEVKISVKADCCAGVTPDSHQKRPFSYVSLSNRNHWRIKFMINPKHPFYSANDYYREKFGSKL